MTRDSRPVDPPHWIDALLMRVVHPRDRDTISGDLLEEYRDAILDGDSRFSANVHYFRQAVSVCFVAVRPTTSANLVLVVACAFAVGGTAWLAAGSPNPAIPIVASVLVAHGLSTIAVIGAGGRLPTLILLPGAAAAVLTGALALFENLSWTTFDWKAALTGATLFVQGILTIALQAGYFGGFRFRTGLS